MPLKDARLSSGPRALFKKRSSLPKVGVRSRPTSWSVGDIFRSSLIENFVVEELGGKSGNLVYGPISVFNGSVAMNVKCQLSNVTVSVTFRGLTEYNGRTLAFINVTEDLWAGDLEPGIKNFLFAFKFPAVNLPPASNEPHIGYSFTAQIKPRVRNSVDPSKPSEVKTYTSKPYVLTFMPYVDPFAQARYDIPDGPVVQRFPVEAMPASSPFTLPPTVGRGTGGKPMLKLTTENLPPSPRLLPVLIPPEPTPLKNPSVEKSAVILDGNERVLGLLKVVTDKSKFAPGDQVKITIILTLPKGTPIPKNYIAKIVERRTLGFIEDEDADQDVEGSNDGDKSRTTSSGKIFHRILTSQRFPISKTAVPVENRPATATSNRSGLEGYTLDSGVEITENLSVNLPTFKTFIDDSLLPTASLPLGPAHKDTAPAASLRPIPSSIMSSKGKEPIRPTTPLRPLTATTVNSTKSVRAVHGLNYIVAHSLNVTIPLSSGLIRRGSGTLEVDLDISLGNRTPDIYGYQTNSIKGSVEVLKVSTPELVVVPPGRDVQDLLMHPDRQTSFDRRPSPLKNMDSFDGVSGVSTPPEAVGSGYRGSSTQAQKQLKPANSRVSFRSLDAIQDVGWKKGERFPTLDDSNERPKFLTS